MGGLSLAHTAGVFVDSREATNAVSEGTIAEQERNMMEYKVVTVRGHGFKETASGDLEATLNEYAREGWRVINSFWLTGTSSITTVLERDAAGSPE